MTLLLHILDAFGGQSSMKSLRQAVRRNIEKFPDDFMLKLKEDEANELISRGVSQSVIPPGYNTGGMQMYAFNMQRLSMCRCHMLCMTAT